MSEPKFKKGEWCFCEFTLQMVKETKDNRITSVSDGMFEMGGHDLSDRCYPIEMIVKQISDNVKHWSSEFHKLKNNALNHPDLNRELIRRWVELCENINNAKELERLSESLNNFGRSVIQKVNELHHEEVQGINIFRR